MLTVFSEMGNMLVFLLNTMKVFKHRVEFKEFSSEHLYSHHLYSTSAFYCICLSNIFIHPSINPYYFFDAFENVDTNSLFPQYTLLTGA